MASTERRNGVRESIYTDSNNHLVSSLTPHSKGSMPPLTKQGTTLSLKITERTEYSGPSESIAPTPFGKTPYHSRKDSGEHVVNSENPFHVDPASKRKSQFVMNPFQRHGLRLGTLMQQTTDLDSPKRPTIAEDKTLDAKKIVSLLKLEGLRTPLQGKLIMNYLVENNSFFKNLMEGDEPLDVDSLISICRNIKYRVYHPGKVIMLEGDEPDGNIYVILTGESIVIKKHMTYIMEQNMRKRVELRKEKSEKNLPFDKEKEKPKDGSLYPKSELSSYQKVSLVSKTIGTLLARSQTPQSAEQKKTNWINKRASPNEDFSMLKVSTQNPLDTSDRAISPKSTLNVMTQARSTLATPNLEESQFQRRGSRRVTRKDSRIIIPGRDSNFKAPAPSARHSLSRNSSVRSINRTGNLDEDDPGSLESGEDLQERIKERAEEYGTVLDSLYPGAVFGELALTLGQKRAATIMTASKTEVLIMKAQDYHLIKAKNEGKKKKIVEFMLKKFPEIEMMGQRVSDNLYYALTEVKVPYGQHLCFEGEVCENLYLIYNGEVQYSKSVIVEERPTAGLDTNVSHHLRLRPHYKEEFFVCTINTGAFCGEECIKSRDNVYYYTAKVVSQPGAVVYKCDKNKFMLRFPNNTATSLLSIFEKKQAERFEILKTRILNKYNNYEFILSHIKPDEDPMKYPLHIRSYANRSIQMKLRMRLFEPQGDLTITPQTALSKDNHELLRNKLQITKVPELNLAKVGNFENMINKPQTDRGGGAPHLNFFSKHAVKMPMKSMLKRSPSDFSKPTPPLENPLDEENGYFRTLSVKRQYEKQETLIKKTAHFYIPLSERPEREFFDPRGPIRNEDGEENYLERLSVSIKKLSEAKVPENLPLEHIDEFKIGIHTRSKEEEMRHSYYKKKIRRDLGIDPKVRPQPFQTSHNITAKLNRVKKLAVKSVVDQAVLDVINNNTGRSSTHPVEVEPEAEYEPDYDASNEEELYNFIFITRGPPGNIKKGKLKAMIPTPTEDLTSLNDVITVNSTRNTQNTYTEPTTITKQNEISNLTHAERLKLRHKRHIMLKTPRLRSVGDLEALKNNKSPLILTDIVSPHNHNHQSSKSLFHSRVESQDKKKSEEEKYMIVFK